MVARGPARMHGMGVQQRAHLTQREAHAAEAAPADRHAAGQPRTKVRGIPTLLLRALGVVNPIMRELVEMQYEYQAPFIVDSRKITDKLGAHATPLDTAIEATLASYRP